MFCCTLSKSSVRSLGRVRSLATNSPMRCQLSTVSDNNSGDKKKKKVSEADKLKKLFAEESQVDAKSSAKAHKQHSEAGKLSDYFTQSDQSQHAESKAQRVSDMIPKPKGREFVRNLMKKQLTAAPPKEMKLDGVAEAPEQVLGEEMVSATKAAAAALKGETTANEVAMLKKLLDFEAETYVASQATPTPAKPVSFEKLMETIKVGQTKKPAAKKPPKPEMSHDEEDKLIAEAQQHMENNLGSFREQIRSPVDRFWPSRGAQGRTYDLVGGERLHIFQPELMTEDRTYRSATFAELQQEQLRRYYCQEPRNGFEEMIRWTEEGKMYPFPIDNEYLSEESDVGFHEHVFLDHLIDEGFPKKGPVRQFMELVINGMSKNPYMTVKQKHAHVEWFREFFQERGAEIDKLHLLETGGAQIAPPAQP